MIPVYLKIKGLYSYQKEQEIDFEPLTSASLFGIFGAVGSGKSSVLEAITFALYGDTERLNKSGDDRTYNMMNLRSDDLLIDFECIAGRKGEHYKFTVRGKRNSKNFKEVKTFERRAYIKTDGEWVPVPESESIENIIGLSYDNFRRSIIIPQGRFQEFIELKDAERTKMMKELFQLEKYDLSGKVISLNRQNDVDISNVEGQLTAVGEVNSEMISAAENQRMDIRNSIQRTEEDLLIQTKIEAELTQRKLLAEKILALKTRFSELNLRKNEISERSETLRVFEICSLHFKGLLDQKGRVLKNLQTAQAEFDKNETRKKELGSILTELYSQREIQRPAYEKREELIRKAEELEKLIEILTNKKSIEKTSASLQREELLLKAKEEEIAILKKQKLEKEQGLEDLKLRLPDFNDISKVNAWFAKAQGLAENKDAIVKDGKKLGATKTESEQKIGQAIANMVEKFGFDIPSDLSQQVFNEAVTDRLLSIETNKKAIDQEIIDFNTRHSLRQYAVELKDGDPCPLCGAVHHPLLASHEADNPQIIDEFNIRKNKLATEERDIRKASLDIDRLYQEVKMYEGQTKELREKYKLAADNEKHHEKEFVWEQFSKDKKDEFEKYEKEVETLQVKLKSEDTLLKNITQNLTKSEEEVKEKFEKPLQALRDDILAKQHINQTLSGQFSVIKLSDYEQPDGSDIRLEVQNLRLQFEEIKKTFELAEGKIDIFEKENNTLSGSQNMLVVSLETSRNELVSLDESIQSQMIVYQFDKESDIQNILSKPLDIAAERKSIDEYNLALNNVKRDLENLQADGLAHAYDAQEHAVVIGKKEQLTTKLNGDRKEEGRLDGLVKKLADDLQKRIVLIKEQTQLNLRKQHLADLARLFRSSGFVDYASSIYLKNLIQSANVRFHQMTHQQLHLELGEGNSFWVRDLLNGGHMRLLKTLSGGQKFQAALSLALALADHLHVRNESKHNFFFLDEGFGSLDKNALQTVFETLKSLRKENRIVGIISHVEDLQQEIQTYLKIENTEEGSKIVESWK